MASHHMTKTECETQLKAPHDPRRDPGPDGPPLLPPLTDLAEEESAMPRPSVRRFAS